MTPPTATRRGVLAGSAACAASLLTAGRASGRSQGSESDADIPSLIEDRVEASLDEHDIPGASVAVVTDGEIAMTAGYGVADRDTDAPVTESTPFRIGSISKPVVWTAIARLVTDGDLDPTAPVANYLPDDLPWWDDPVTLAQLATHTAGFEPTNRGMWYPSPDGVRSLRTHLERSTPAQVRDPGTVGSYSNHGAGIAGQALASTVGEAFPDAIEAALLDPAGMETSSFEQPLPDAIRDAHATGHDAPTVDGKFAGIGIAPAGAMSASARDMARFMQLHLNDGIVGGTRVLEPETIDRVHRRWFTHHEELAGTTFGFVERYQGDVRLLWHNGATRSFHSHLVLAPDHGFGLFISYNGAEAASAREEVPAAVLDELFPSPEPDVPDPTGRPTRASELAGTYRTLQVPETTHDRFPAAMGASTVEVSIADDGALVMDDGNDESRWIETEPLVFVHAETGEKRAFGEADGEIGYLFLDGTPTALASVAWYERVRAHGVLALAGLVGLLSGWIRWSPSREADESRRAWLASLRSNPRRLAKLPVHVGSIAVLGFLVATFVYLSTAPLRFLSDPALAYRATFVLALLGGTSAIGGALAGIAVWREGFWDVRRRLHYSAIVAALLAMTGLLWYWNLLFPP